MNLQARLRSLEGAALLPASAVCPECGGGSGPTQYRLVPIALPPVRGQPRPEPVRSSRPETCPRCGRRLVVRMLPITIDEK